MQQRCRHASAPRRKSWSIIYERVTGLNKRCDNREVACDLPESIIEAGDIGNFPNTEAMEPLRVYVGLNSADTVAERARLALEELQRVGAFERSVLIVVTPTGTGAAGLDGGRHAPA